MSKSNCKAFGVTGAIDETEQMQRSYEAYLERQKDLKTIEVRRRYADLTDEELKSLYVCIYPFASNKLIEVDRKFAGETQKDNAYIKVTAGGLQILLYNSDGAIEAGEFSFNPFAFVGACIKLNLIYKHLL